MSETAQIINADAIDEYVEQVIRDSDTDALIRAVGNLANEVKELQKELKIANRFKDLYLHKWEKWEERARAMHQELKIGQDRAGSI